jgi:nucleotide-binding universal stress UspA family protein
MDTDKNCMLVTTDGSPHSLRVLRHAAVFARAGEASLKLARLVEPESDIVEEAGETAQAALARALAAAVTDLNAVLENAGLEGEALSASVREDESIAEGLVRLAGEQGAGIVAIDTRGYGALHHLLQGSVAMDLLSKTTLPVMLTGEGIVEASSAPGVYRLLATSDGSHASTDVMRALAPLLRPGRFAVTLLRVHETKPDEDRLQVRAQIQRQLDALRSLFPAGLEVETRIREIVPAGGTDTAIIEEAKRVRAAAIACSTHGMSAARHLIAGSTALLLLGRSPLPVIMAGAQD